MFAVVKLLGSRSLPWLVRALLDFLSQKVWHHVCTRSLLYVHVETCIALSTVQVWETKEWPMSIVNPLNCCFWVYSKWLSVYSRSTVCNLLETGTITLQNCYCVEVWKCSVWGWPHQVKWLLAVNRFQLWNQELRKCGTACLKPLPFPPMTGVLKVFLTMPCQIHSIFLQHCNKPFSIVFGSKMWNHLNRLIHVCLILGCYQNMSLIWPY